MQITHCTHIKMIIMVNYALGKIPHHLPPEIINPYPGVEIISAHISLVFQMQMSLPFKCHEAAAISLLLSAVFHLINTLKSCYNSAEQIGI